MKKLMLLALVMYGVSCSNPEDNANGNHDSTRFNADPSKTLNTNPGPTSPDTASSTMADTSSYPGSKSAASPKTGTNRAYGTKSDSTKH